MRNRKRSCLDDGLNNQQIALALNITHGTVKWRVNMILSRLDVHDRTQAAMVALSRGIVERRQAERRESVEQFPAVCKKSRNCPTT